MLTFDDPELLLENPVLQEAYQKELLYISLVRYSPEWAERPQFIEDGRVDDSKLLDYLAQNSSFNKEQYLLEHDDTNSHCIVKAGAGTGKTTTMINRLMFLKHIDPSFDLRTAVMITFTNEAAAHMRAKLLQKLKNYYDMTKDRKYLEWMEQIDSMTIGTIHSFARKFLVSEGQALGFSRTMKIRSYKHERQRAIEKYIDQFSREQPEIYDRFRHIPHYQIIRSLNEMIEQIQHKSMSSERVQTLDFGSDIYQFHALADYVIKRVIRELDERKQAEETLEMGDLISRLAWLSDLPSDALTLDIRYLFIDEMQDTDEVQVAFISWLVEKYGCQLFAVGDVKQSIYRFRGADYTAFSQLQQRLEAIGASYRLYALQKNYRSTQILLRQLNTLFRKWPHVVEKFLFDYTDELLPGREGQEDEEGLVALELDDVSLNYLLSRLQGKNIAVLVRSNREVLETVKRIEHIGFFCDAVVSGAFYRSLPVREFYLLIRRLTHPKVAKDRYLFHQSSYGENDLTIARVLSAYSAEKQFILELLEPFDRSVDENYNWNTEAALDVLQKIIADVKPHEVFRLRYYAHLRRRFPDGDMELQKKEAVAKMKEYKMNLERLLYLLKRELGGFRATLYDIEAFLAVKMATDATENEEKLEEEEVTHRIKVMTVHKAKGLEFDYVILPLTKSNFTKQGMTDVLFTPHSARWRVGYYINWNGVELQNSHYKEHIGTEKQEIAAEEARLLYVALTRAKRAVYVNSSSPMSQYTVKCWDDLLESGEMLHV
ncbi:DNA helicase-2/ATP-dependent DNA helicase PcrA [Anoxybacillus voinovskiensis]|uniref:DNA 3'-5' helicase n=1 Tax=Anoxybacteroides voinovskiense TaxID=230470 RepID=A0A840DS57_9BACL|nr:UvrD-helicase domain-containing protein [Anoxybacillus voinovskiensis]MBB4074445.1 DNA helicase-2/ATP-dependent DNA helicase PcrA [Anoxybacillus voinovskiensis]